MNAHFNLQPVCVYVGLQHQRKCSILMHVSEILVDGNILVTVTKIFQGLRISDGTMSDYN